ncbi:hypothetical protein EVAR_23904_1 [Eumeta japonica]|uniref:Uncharacterized protein n=1 Tax=Eumeta variegata TaxID=151549 RepID=A0A4C1V408_EUMVA|nr:hypothetical protein EVAR_23904_1 [Eumeta japonica]
MIWKPGADTIVFNLNFKRVPDGRNEEIQQTRSSQNCHERLRPIGDSHSHYHRSERNPISNVEAGLIAAKRRVPPLKVTSVLRFELQATVLGVQLARNAVEEDDELSTRRVYRSDSKTVLT